MSIFYSNNISISGRRIKTFVLRDESCTLDGQRTTYFLDSIGHSALPLHSSHTFRLGQVLVMEFALIFREVGESAVEDQVDEANGVQYRHGYDS